MAKTGSFIMYVCDLIFLLRRNMYMCMWVCIYKDICLLFDRMHNTLVLYEA